MAGPLPDGIVSEDWAAVADDLPPQPPPFGLDALPAEGLTTELIAHAAPQVVGRLALTHVGEIGPPGHFNVSILGGGPTITYNYPGDASVRATLLVDDVTPGVTTNEAIRFIFNLLFAYGRGGERSSPRIDLRLDAPIPYVLSGNPERGYDLMFGTRTGDWVVSVHAQTMENLEALVRALMAELD
jgi:hypothetical protein